MKKDVKIGITGASGVLGKILLKQLGDQSIFTCFEGNIVNSEDVQNWIVAEKPDQIFHLAALVAIKEVDSNPINGYKININGMINLLSAIQVSNTKPWVFFSSTSHVYKSSDRSITETSDIEPINTYGLTKYMAEKILIDFSGKYPINYCIGRIFSFYHDTQKEPFLYPTMMRRLSEHTDHKEPFIVYGANNIRDISNAESIVEAIIRLSKVNAEGVFNLGVGHGVRIIDFVRSLTKRKLGFQEINSETPDVLVADVSKINTLLKQYEQ